MQIRRKQESFVYVGESYLGMEIVIKYRRMCIMLQLLMDFDSSKILCNWA